MPHKIIPLGPWRRDNNYYAENIVLDATQVTPMGQGYRGGHSVSKSGNVEIASVETDVVPMEAHASNEFLYFTVYGAALGGSIYRSAGEKDGGTVPVDFSDITDGAGWTGDPLASITRYGSYVVFGSLVDKLRYIDEAASPAMTEVDDLCLTSTPPSSTAGNTANINARFVATYKEHLVAAYVKMGANYPTTNPIFANGSTHSSLVWLSMTDNIRRFASPVAHPEVRGSVPLQLLDDGGPITGIIGGEECYIFKELAVYRLVGPPFDLVRISKDIGTVSPKSIVEVAGVVYFMSNMGPAMISGGRVSPVSPEMFANAIHSYEHTAYTNSRWASDPHYMLPDLLQSRDEIKYLRGVYSDITGCVVWASQSGRYFMLNVNPPYGMSHGKTIDVGSWGTSVTLAKHYAIARSSGDNFFTGSGGTSLTNNFFFFKSLEDNYDILKVGIERYSGFGNNDSSYPIQFTIPMTPFSITEQGVMTTRVTGFRIVGEGAGKVTSVAVRTVKGWNDVPVVSSFSGANLVSRDGWVTIPPMQSFSGKYHSISFKVTTDQYTSGDTDSPSMPYFMALDVAYEEVPSRGG